MLAKPRGWGVGGWGVVICVKHSLSLSVKHLLLDLATAASPSPSFSSSLSLSFFSPPGRRLSVSLRLAANNAGVVRYHQLLLLRRVEAAQRLSSKRQTPVFCHSFDCYPSLLRTSTAPSFTLLWSIVPGCLPVRGHLPTFLQLGEVSVCNPCDSLGGATTAPADFLMECVGFLSKDLAGCWESRSPRRNVPEWHLFFLVLVSLIFS